MFIQKNNKLISTVFFSLTIVFVIFALSDDRFFEWVFERHHNLHSWYIRPLFLIPFCYFAYKQNLAAVAFSIFCLFTSMFWFPKPETVQTDVLAFLRFEKEWLQGDFGPIKVLLSLAIPASLFALAYSFWKRSLAAGIAIVFLIALAKTLWSIQSTNGSGEAVIIPAIIGFLLCAAALFYLTKRKKGKIN